jgi:hypothetical protein
MAAAAAAAAAPGIARVARNKTKSETAAGERHDAARRKTMAGMK